MKIRPRYATGLTRWEVTALAVCGVALLGLMVLLILPGFARSKRGHHDPIMRCTSNLKQAVLASLIWANDNDGQFPFASTKAGSSLAWVNSPEVFRHFQVMSNELVTPKILNCRADATRWVAEDFTGLANANLSYFVGLDARLDSPQSILTGDRNITGGTLSNGFLRVLSTNTAAEWTQGIHHNIGNIGLADGSVRRVTTPGLRQQLALQSNAVIRLAVP